jgi:hypothetical protein
MPFMMNKHLAIYILLAFFSKGILAQTNLLSSSPYSLYGLGLSNETSTGKINGLGGFGIALPSNTFINNSNPASFGSISLNSFFFDFGLKSQTNTLSESGNSNSNIIANVSNLAFAFPLTKKSGIGVILIPFTNVGYTIANIESGIEGSSDTFLSNIEGSGGINNLKIDYGYALSNTFRLGLNVSTLFGKITQRETDILPNNVLIIEEESRYSGFRLGAGFQYDLSITFTFGGIINLPTKLSGNKESTISQYSLDETIDLSDSNNTSNDKIEDFKLPTELGFGIQTTFKNYFSLNVDYKRNFWTSTNQSDQLGDYVDQDSFGLGLQYAREKKASKFFNNLEYRAGFNYNNGNLEINNQRINNYALNLGIGIPFNNGTNSMVNIGYSYGRKGQVSNGLIKENYHLFSINLSLEGIWFQKRKIN